MTFEDWWGAYPTQEDYEANCRDAWDASAAIRDAEVAELREELTIARFQNAVVYGTSHPEIYKTNEDFLQEHVKLLRYAVAKAAAHVKPTCNDLYEELMQSLASTKRHDRS